MSYEPAKNTRHVIIAILLLLLFVQASQAAESDWTDALPDTMLWTSYPVGSAGHAEASAIANALVNEYGIRVRISPSSSAIGRLQPLISGRLDYGFLGSASYFSSEGLFEFAHSEWGPQNLRMVAGRLASLGLVTAADAGIRLVSDVAGHRVAFVAGNPSINLLCEAVLAFAGLTRDDVKAITFPTYGAAMDSLAQGKADATCTTTTPSQMYQLAESPRGIYWVDMPPENKTAWARVYKIAPFVQPFKETGGAGVSMENPAHLFAYRYPTIATQPNRSSDEVYAFIKALDKTYDMYSKATDLMYRWRLSSAGTTPSNLPFHEGAVRYLREIGVWTPQMQAWNEARIKRLNTLMGAWEKAVAATKDLGDDAFSGLWQQYRQKALASLDDA